MQKLGALDANFLYTETELMPNHVASVQQLELPEGVSATEFVEGFKKYMLARLHLVPYWHRKLRFVPGNLDHPLWVEATDININKHVIEIPLQAPATRAQVETRIADLHSINMDRSRPLWAIYVLTGLEDGTVYFYNQVHHAAIDGMAGQAAIMTLFDTIPEHLPVEGSLDDLAADEDSMATLMQMSLENLLKYQVSSASRMLRGMESMRKLIQRAVDPTLGFGAFAERAPKTRFNHMIGKARAFAVGELPLSDVRKMGKQLGCTVNDVFMAISAGALRKYLLRHGELPETSLIAGCPVSLRRPGSTDMGNQVTMMNVNLATHIEDPKLRLLAINESSRVAKSVTADLADAFDSETSMLGLPAMMSMAAAAAERGRLADRLPTPMNVVISNVPGPREEQFANGARMLTHYPVSIPAHGVGLNITVQSYQDKMYFGLTGCARALPDASQLRDDLLAAFLELRQVLMPNNVAEFKAGPAKEIKEAAATTPAHDVTKVA